MEKTEFVTGNTTTIVFQTQDDDGTPLVLNSSIRIMILVYNSVDVILFQACYPEDILRINDTTYSMQLTHEVTQNFKGRLTMEFSVYDDSMVIIAKNKKEISWSKNLSSKHIQR